MVRDWLQKYWRAVVGLTISAMLLAVMVRLANLTAHPPGTYDPRLDGLMFLTAVFSVWAMMALRNWAKKHEK